MSSKTTSTATSSSGSTNVHSAQAENVHVKSVVQTETQSKVSLENSKKITDLMARLGKFYKQLKLICLYFSFQVQHIFKWMNIHVDVLKK